MNRRRFIGILLSLGIFVQLYILTIDYLVPFGRDIWKYRYQSARARSAFMASYVDKEDAEFLLFIKDTIPENVTVFFFETHGIYSWKPFLQYILFPRHVITCQVQDIKVCIAGRKAGDVLVQTQDEPFFQNGGYSFIPYRDHPSLGLFVQR